MTLESLQQQLSQAVEFYHAGNLPEVERVCRAILAALPGQPNALFLLAVIARDCGKHEIAEQLITAAAQGDPKNTTFLNHLGLILTDLAEYDRAESVFNQTLALDGQNASTHGNLAVVYMRTLRLDRAVAALEKAIALSSEDADFHNGLAQALLTLGDFSRGWRELEWRWRTPWFLRNPLNLNKPNWDGSPLGDRTLFVPNEQGFGDTIQFCRYLQMLVRAGNKVIFGCDPALGKLMRQARDLGTICTEEPLPDYDVYCPMMSLPFMLGSSADTIPNEVPYLAASSEDVERLKKTKIPGLHVGLIWAGRPTHAQDRARSMSLSQFAPLANIPGVHFYSLQKGDRANEPAPAGLSVVRLGDQLNDFADTAVVIDALDLVISVDTAMVHLAGALNRPCWVLLPFSPDWRWLLDRPDSPWYPSLKLYRQPSPGDWGSVLSKVADDLAKLARASS